ncbi:MAG: bifunctional nuclease family protein [Pedococcus sp.]
MKELEVLGVRVEMPTNHPIVLLRERDGDRYLPIWIGAAEATAIAYAQQGIEPPRPLTHDLMKNLIEGLGHTLTEVRIVELKDGVFHAALVLDGTTEISSRSSDAIALALRTGTTIVAGESLLEEAGVAMTGEEDKDDEVERFREFLDHVSAEDFETKPGETGPGA